MKTHQDAHDRVVITGIGLISSVGNDREAVWHAIQRGRSGVRGMTGIPGIPDGSMLGAQVRLGGPEPPELKNFPLCSRTVAEALTDAGIRPKADNRHRFGCSITGHMGDMSYIADLNGRPDMFPPGAPWHTQWMPNSACARVASEFGLYGPRMSNVTACASSTIGIISATRAIRDGLCDYAVAGGSEIINPLIAAGFSNMRVLAQHDDPVQACRPFDAGRSGFVMGEGAAMFVLERLDLALARGASIYAEVVAGGLLNDARHVTSLEGDSTALVQLIRNILRQGGLVPRDIDLVNAHGTGTQQNDAMESHGVRAALGRAADRVNVTANKSMIGHLVSASGAVELAITALAMRDAFCPPTLNLTHPDPKCDLDCTPLVGRDRAIEHALKLSIAFGGHMAAIALRRWDGPGERESRRDWRQALPVAA